MFEWFTKAKKIANLQQSIIYREQVAKKKVK